MNIRKFGRLRLVFVSGADREAWKKKNKTKTQSHQKQLLVPEAIDVHHSNEKKAYFKRVNIY